MVRVQEFEARFPRQLTPEEWQRANVLLSDAADLIREEFAREGKRLDEELVRAEWLSGAVRRVTFEMVSAVLLVGSAAGVRQRSITVGDTTESTTWADVESSAWGGLRLSTEHRRALGLVSGARASGNFPAALRWPERQVSRVRRTS